MEWVMINFLFGGTPKASIKRLWFAAEGLEVAGLGHHEEDDH